MSRRMVVLTAALDRATVSDLPVLEAVVSGGTGLGWMPL